MAKPRLLQWPTVSSPKAFLPSSQSQALPSPGTTSGPAQTTADPSSVYGSPADPAASTPSDTATHPSPLFSWPCLSDALRYSRTFCSAGSAPSAVCASARSPPHWARTPRLTCLFHRVLPRPLHCRARALGVVQARTMRVRDPSWPSVSRPCVLAMCSSPLFRSLIHQCKLLPSQGPSGSAKTSSRAGTGRPRKTTHGRVNLGVNYVSQAGTFPAEDDSFVPTIGSMLTPLCSWV
jgi:hypothetical protein